jgi:hypothetical protein
LCSHSIRDTYQSVTYQSAQTEDASIIFSPQVQRPGNATTNSHDNTIPRLVTCTLPTSHDDHPDEQRELTDCAPGSMSSACQCRPGLVDYSGLIRRSSPRTLTIGRPRRLQPRLPKCTYTQEDMSNCQQTMSSAQIFDISLTPGDAAAYKVAQAIRYFGT